MSTQTKHTTGPWRLGDIEPQYNEIGAYQVAIVQKERGGRIIPGFAFGETKEQCLANARLIASATSMLNTLEQTYLEIQTLVQKDLNVGRATLAVKTDSMRASLRNQISASTGEDCQALQERIESLAYNKAKGI